MKFDAGRDDAMQAPLDAGKVWAVLGLVFGVKGLVGRNKYALRSTYGVARGPERFF